MDKDNWNIFDLPQETKKVDIKGIILSAIVIALLTFVILN